MRNYFVSIGIRHLAHVCQKKTKNRYKANYHVPSPIYFFHFFVFPKTTISLVEFHRSLTSFLTPFFSSLHVSFFLPFFVLDFSTPFSLLLVSSLLPLFTNIHLFTYLFLSIFPTFLSILSSSFLPFLVPSPISTLVPSFIRSFVHSFLLLFLSPSHPSSSLPFLSFPTLPSRSIRRWHCEVIS